MKSHRNRTLVFLLIASQALWLASCSYERKPVESNSDLVLIRQTKDGASTLRITSEQLYALPTFTKDFKFEANGEDKKTKAVYLSDVLKTYLDDGVMDFWLLNCGDKYQSNFSPEQIQTARPYLILEVEDKPLVEWLEELGHPEWGPNIINIENTNGLLDPGHKSPWGVTDIIAVTRQQALTGISFQNMNESTSRGLDLYLNSCASCHQSGNGITGGSVSTRNLQTLSVLAKHAEAYVRKMLKDPQATNPLAVKMPGYAHWSEENISDLIAFLKSRN